MARFDPENSKHNHDACMLAPASVGAAVRKKLEQAYEACEAELVDRVCIELCSPCGQIQNMDEFFWGLKNTVYDKHLSFGLKDI